MKRQQEYLFKAETFAGFGSLVCTRLPNLRSSPLLSYFCHAAHDSECCDKYEHLTHEFENLGELEKFVKNYNSTKPKQKEMENLSSPVS